MGFLFTEKITEPSNITISVIYDSCQQVLRSVHVSRLLLEVSLAIPGLLCHLQSRSVTSHDAVYCDRLIQHADRKRVFRTEIKSIIPTRAIKQTLGQVDESVASDREMLGKNLQGSSRKAFNK